MVGPDFAGANVTTGSWFLDQSNELPDGVNYGQVDIAANAATGKVSFTVTAFDSMYSPGTPDNFGIQTFGFNYNGANVSATPGNWTWNLLPLGWSTSYNNPNSRAELLTSNIVKFLTKLSSGSGVKLLQGYMLRAS